MAKEDFILPTRRPKLRDNYRYFKFEHEKYYWKDSAGSDELKKLIFIEDRRIALYRYNTIKLKPGDFISPLEKQILALMIPDYFNGLKDFKKSNLFEAHIFCIIALL